MSIAYIKTPGGEELAILPREELEALLESVDHAHAVAAYRGGQAPGLSPEEARALVLAASPLAFWRKYRKWTQTSLAEAAGIAQNYLSDLENGKRGGDVTLWLKFARALELPVEALVDEAD